MTYHISRHKKVPRRLPYLSAAAPPQPPTTNTNTSASNSIYNEVAFLALNEVAPVTHAVTNTVKRVVIILVSILFFRTPITGQRPRPTLIIV